MSFQPRSLRQTVAEEIVLRSWNARSSRIIEKKANNSQMEIIAKTIFLQRPSLIPDLGQRARENIENFARDLRWPEDLLHRIENLDLLASVLRILFIANPGYYIQKGEPHNPNDQMPLDIKLLEKYPDETEDFTIFDLQRMLVFIDMSNEQVFRKITENFVDATNPEEIKVILFNNYPHVIPNQLEWSNRVAYWISQYQYNWEHERDYTYLNTHTWIDQYLRFCLNRGFRPTEKLSLQIPLTFVVWIITAFSTTGFL